MCKKKEDSIVNECSVLKDWKVCFSENNNLWQINLLQYRTPQFPEYISNQVSDIDKHDCEGWELSVLIPFGKHVMEREGKVEKFKECFVPRQRTE
jgi:hypothetical protein